MSANVCKQMSSMYMLGIYVKIVNWTSFASYPQYMYVSYVSLSSYVSSVITVICKYHFDKF